jgi:nucleotide-binding universal stress UspA family protein
MPRAQLITTCANCQACTVSFGVPKSLRCGEVMKPRAGQNTRGQPDVLFRHILVPTDLTERTEKALQLAGRLAVSDTSRITLLHVIETIDRVRFDELKSFYERLERKARAAMTRFARRATARQVESALVYGRRAEEIVNFAAANAVDLIVLASHRVKPSRVNRDWGTISYKVGILAQCPVLLVK